jgi:ribose transport system substrate-binding protein
MNHRLLAWLAFLPLLACGGCIDSAPSTPAPTPTATGTKVTPESTGEVKRIIFLTNGDDPFWDALNSGLKEGEKDFELAKIGLKAERDVNSATAEGQIKRLQQYGSSNDIAGIAISVIQADNPAIVAEMRNLQKKGIPVITVDGDVNRTEFRDARQFYLGTDNIVGGRTLGTAAKALLEARKLESGGYVQFAGFTDNDNARSRMNGFKEAVGEKFTEKDRMADQMDRNRAQDNVRSALTNHDDLVALVGIWAYNAPAIANVVEERKVREKTTVVTFDAQAVAIEDMAQGKIDAMVVQNPFDMGYQTVKLMKAMIQKDQGVIDEMFPNKDKPDGDIYTTGLRVVVPNAESPIKKVLFDEKVVEYMLLPDFQAWLKKYNLTSS